MPCVVSQNVGKSAQNPNIQLISIEQSNMDPKLNIIMQSGLSTEGLQPNNPTQYSDVLVRRLDVKKPGFDIQKEK